MKSGKEVISDIIKRRELKGYSAAELARRVGISRAAQSRYEKGERSFPVNDIDKYAIALDTTVEELLGLTKEINKKEKLDEKETNIIIPLYGDIAAGALSTLNGVIEKDVTYISIPVQFFNGHSRVGAFALHVNGESMNKIIPNRSYVICLPLEKANLSDGQIVIFSHDGEYSMKRFINNAEDEVLIFRPESNDPKFRDIVIDYHTTRDLKIYAKVIGYYVNLGE
ncbi:LexA family protein [Sporolactobacillus terrae]|uniref:HTH cro/C1-type domain-containing protein n=1 Tax=Sporolactobacillus terrae TaxID=269673 RepID=A0A5K7WXT2_9BACL|nr:LexA family transcriptional regulator [Sporolactobacillus terrae]BBN99197.1 hypothetical protein St703_19020 [Sporolactobacillus terrae]